MKTRSQARKKTAREARRSDVNLEVQQENRVSMPMNRDRLKKEYLDSRTM